VRAYASGRLRMQDEPAPGPDAICLAVVIEDGGGMNPSSDAFCATRKPAVRVNKGRRRGSLV